MGFLFQAGSETITIKSDDCVSKLKSENLPICDKELQQRWAPKPPVFAPFFFGKEMTTENYLTIGNETKII